MKYGVLTFSYKNFEAFRKLYSEAGFYSINLGDYMQTLAVRHLYRQLGIGDADVVSIDRDDITSYAGDPVVLPMNACFYKWCFPLPPAIVPVFIGFQASAAMIGTYKAYLKQYEPIGCRDRETANAMQAHGIAAVTTGCLTLSFPERIDVPDAKKVLAIHGSGAGEFPAEVLKHMPDDLLQLTEFVFQRMLVQRFPLSPSEMLEAERYASHLLESYRRRATLVVTPLHHAATPCAASGIPVVLCRRADNARFSYLREIMPLYLSPDFAQLDWAARHVNVAPVRDRLIETARAAINTAVESCH